jgi:hypothetical protein
VSGVVLFFGTGQNFNKVTYVISYVKIIIFITFNRQFFGGKGNKKRYEKPLFQARPVQLLQ